MAAWTPAAAAAAAQPGTAAPPPIPLSTALRDLPCTQPAQLTELEATAKGLTDELAGGAAATPRLRELLAQGARLVTAVQQAGTQLGPLLPAAGAPLPAAPGRAAVGEQWKARCSCRAGRDLVPL